MVGQPWALPKFLVAAASDGVLGSEPRGSRRVPDSAIPRVVKQTRLVNFFERKHGFLGWQAGFVCMKAKK